MSYRLIDSNSLASSCPDANGMPCIYADLPNGLDGGHYAITASATCELKQHACTSCGMEINDKAYFVRVDLGDGAWTAESRQARFCPSCGKRFREAVER